MDYENCIYFKAKDITPWHGDIFDHPDYAYFCTREGKEKEICWPVKVCNRCKNFKKE